MDYSQMIDHGSSRYRDKLLKLCSPLVDPLCISDFYYGTVSNEGMVAEIGTNLDWLYLYAHKGLYLNNPFYTSPLHLSSGVYLHRAIKLHPYQTTVHEAKNRKLYPFLIVIEKK